MSDAGWKDMSSTVKVEKRTGIDDKVIGPFGGILAYTSEKEACGSVLVANNGDEVSILS